MVKDFIWNDQNVGKKPRVKYNILLLPKEDRGLGLISIKAQTIALACKTILGIVAEGEHTLQSIYMAKIGALSCKRWGIDDLSWMVSKCRVLLEDESKLWTNYYWAWNMNKKNIEPRPLANWEEKKKAPLWVPNTIHKVPFTGRSNLVGQQEFIVVGINRVEDITDWAGHITK